MKQAGYQPEGMVSNAWAKGYKLGIITSSDHGSTHISYAMVYTGDPSRQGVLDAIRKRHTYGATDNIILEVRMGKYFMGDEFALNKPEPIRVKVRGTGKVAKVEIIKDSKIIYATEPKTQDVSFEFTDRGEVSGRHYYYVRVQQEDQMIAWSSPFFINYHIGAALALRPTSRRSPRRSCRSHPDLCVCRIRRLSAAAECHWRVSDGIRHRYRGDPYPCGRLPGLLPRHRQPLRAPDFRRSRDRHRRYRRDDA